MFEILEHTADIGFRARAKTLPELFETAAEALVSIAIEIDEVEPVERYSLAATGDDTESLLVNWLSEVLWLLDGKRIGMRKLRVAMLEEGHVSGEALGETLDPARHHARLVVKGVTYHQLKVVQDESGWCAEVFLDI